jgi:hypothetical protein
MGRTALLMGGVGAGVGIFRLIKGPMTGRSLLRVPFFSISVR